MTNFLVKSHFRQFRMICWTSLVPFLLLLLVVIRCCCSILASTYSGSFIGPWGFISFTCVWFQGWPRWNTSRRQCTKRLCWNFGRWSWIGRLDNIRDESRRDQSWIEKVKFDAIKLRKINFCTIRVYIGTSRLYTQLEYLKNKTLRQDNPHISKRRGGRKVAHRRFSLQVNLNFLLSFSPFFC